MNSLNLPVLPPLKPMLAKAIGAQVPTAEGLLFEPKWDGFRCVVFRDHDGLELGSRNERPLTRYFPELHAPLREALPNRCVIDGELIVAGGSAGVTKLDFNALQQRIHPAQKRVDLLARETPALFVAFDLLALDDRDLRPEPFEQRRAVLETVLSAVQPPIYLTPITGDVTLASEWFNKYEGAGLDGLIAKPAADPYVENKRTQLKVKHVRSADAVVAGFRWHKDGVGVGSLLLGLYDQDMNLRHVGVAASFTAKQRSELVKELEPLQDRALPDHPWSSWAEAANDGSMPGAVNRWSAAKDHSWVPLRLERVAEVKYGSTLNGRFRDVTKMLGWRFDKDPRQCLFDQLSAPADFALETVFEGGL